MCGLVGVYGAPSKKLRSVFEDLFNMDYIRGRDSAGVCLMRNNKVPVIVKDIMHPAWIVDDADYKEVVFKDDPFGFMGHNRAATRGRVLVKNAHPFRHGNIVLCHNGTVTAPWHLPNHIKYDTDSEAICAAIDELGVAEAWKRVDGAATITWYNIEEKSFNVLSNNKRPFNWGITKDHSAIVWASEALMLRCAANRNELDLEAVWYPAADTHYRFDFNGKEVAETHQKLDPFVPTFRSYQAPAQTFTPYGTFDDEDAEYELWPRREKSATQGTGSSVAVTGLNRFLERGIQKIFSDKRGNRLETVDLKAKMGVDQAMFEKDFHNCIFCHESLTGDYEGAVIVDKDEKRAICSDCAHSAQENNITVIGRLN